MYTAGSELNQSPHARSDGLHSDYHPVAVKIGCWFEESIHGSEFKIIDVDQRSGLIAVQFADGSIEEFDQEEWMEMDPTPISHPMDWMAFSDSNLEDDNDYFDDDPFIVEDQHTIEGIDNVIDDLNDGWTDNAIY